MFRELSPAVCLSVASVCRSRRFEAGQHLLNYRDSSDDVFIVLEGSVRATLFSRQGREVAFENLKPGDMFGEIAAIDQQGRSASVVATAKSVVAVMEASAFRAMLRTHPLLAMRVLERLATLSRNLCTRVVEFSTLDVRQRVRSELVRLALPWVDAAGRAEIRNVPTHAEIASRISSHREAVTREINRLERRGLIRRTNRRFVVPDVAELRKYALET